MVDGPKKLGDKVWIRLGWK